jgi:hypothetical protein
MLHLQPMDWCSDCQLWMQGLQHSNSEFRWQTQGCTAWIQPVGAVSSGCSVEPTSNLNCSPTMEGLRIMSSKAGGRRYISW